MASLDSIVSVTIDAQTTTPTQTGFGIPLVVGFHTTFAERTRVYTSLAALVADGFGTSTSIYRAVRSVFAQNPRPPSVVVGRLTTGSVKTMDLTPVVQNTHAYVVDVNGTSHTFTSDANATAAEIVDGLVSAINAGAQAASVTASNVSNVLHIVGDVAGVQFTLDASFADFAQQNNTPDTSGIAAQIAAISLENDTWYALIMDSQGELEILAAAAAVEATGNKIFLAATGNSDVLGAGSTDVASDLEAAAYDRTALLFSRNPDDYPNAAWAGKVLPDLPGSSTWKFKTLAGITVDSFTSTETTNLSNKQANFYQAVAGINITAEGEMSSGEFIDVTIFVDWLKARIQESVFAIKANVKKVPFTDAGIALVEGAIRGRIAEGITNGGLVAGTEQVLVPKAADVSPADRAARRLTGITFQAQLAGAIHSTVIAGTVTV